MQGKNANNNILIENILKKYEPKNTVSKNSITKCFSINTLEIPAVCDSLSLSTVFLTMFSILQYIIYLLEISFFYEKKYFILNLYLFEFNLKKINTI